MVKRTVILFLFFAFKVNAQTTVYAATPEGLPNKSKYYFFEYANLFVCDSCKEGFKDDGSFERFKTVHFNNDQIIIHFGPKSDKGTMMFHGYFTNEKKIFYGIYDKDGNEVFAPKQEEIKTAPYIYDKKIYDSEGKVIAFIEGEEKYGAAWYLLTARKFE